MFLLRPYFDDDFELTLFYFHFWSQIIGETLNLICLLGRGTLYTDLDAEIDYLHSVIEKQEVSEINSGPKQSKSQGKKRLLQAC